MKTRASRRPDTAALAARDGFTLLELLIAVGVFAVVLVSINGVFYSALRLRNRTAEASEQAAPLQRALTLMKHDLSNIVPPGGRLSGSFRSQTMGATTTFQQNTSTSTGTSTDGQSEADSLMDSLLSTPLANAFNSSPFFYTSTGALDDTTPWADIQQVCYVLVEPTNGAAGKDLVRCVTRNLLPVDALELPVQERLLGGVEDFEFLFFDGLQWQTYWDSAQMTNALPAAIKVLIQLQAGEKQQTVLAPIELVVPVPVQGWTNETTEASETSQTSS